MWRSNGWASFLAVVLAGLGTVFLSARAAAAQDLFDRAEAERERRRERATVASYSGRDRFDLRAGANLTSDFFGPERGQSRISLDGMIESDFACGKFDLKANLKSLISKEAGEEFVNTLLGAVQSELAYNALMLLAEASPTAFQLFQHWRISANGLLGIQYDRCQAIESAIQDGLQGIKARSLKDCIDEKRREGLSMDEAMRACQDSDEIRGLAGDKVKELDLTTELKKALHLSDVDTARLEGLLSKIRITPSGAKGEIKSEAILERYRELQKEYYGNWVAATDALVADPNARTEEETLAKLAPPGMPGVLPVELRDLANVPAQKRRFLLEQLASQASLLDLTLQVHSIERWLGAASKLPQADQSEVRRVEQELRDLRLQLSQIDEVVRRQERYNAAVLGATATAQEHQSALAAESLTRAQRDSASRAYLDSVPRWGEFPRNGSFGTRSGDRARASSNGSGSRSIQGQGCTDCPTGFGDVNRK